MNPSEPVPARRRGCRYFFNLFLGLIFALVFAYYFVMPVYIAYTLSRTRAPVCCVDVTKLPFAVEDVTFTTTDGIKISAWYTPAQNRAAIILVHGSTANRTATLNHAKFLTEAGYGVLMLDLRGHGDSGGEFFTLGWDSDPDLRAAVDYLQTRADVDPEKIGALGLSMGAEVVLQAAASDNRIKAIVADGAGVHTPTDMLAMKNNGKWLQFPFIWVQYNALSVFTGTVIPTPLTELLPRLAPRPVLLIYGTGGNVPEILMNEVYTDILEETAEVWRIEGVGHIAGVVMRPDEYRTRVVNFLNTALVPAQNEN